MKRGLIVFGLLFVFLFFSYATLHAQTSWESLDIGTSYQGETTVNSEVNIVVKGSGNDIWGSSDSFRYVYKFKETADTLILSTKITSWDGSSDPASKGGIMIRDSTSPSSSYAFVTLTGSKGIKFQWRSSDGAISYNINGPSSFDLPVWLRLVKSGDSVTSYYSSDGSMWTQIGNATVAPISFNYLLGVAVTSHNDGAYAQATFDLISSFFGLPLNTPTPSLNNCMPPGDASGDGKVTGVDYVIWLNHYNQTTTNGCVDGDFSGDNKVTGVDYVIWLNHYGETAQIPTATPTSKPSATPTVPPNVTNTPTPKPTSTPSGPSPTLPPPPPPGSGVWISQSEIMSRSTSGDAWSALYSDASGSWGSADVSNQDSDHDQYTLAGALVCARTGQFCDKTRQALLSAIGTEEGARWLAVGRNMLGYTIAADVMKNSNQLTGTDLSKVSTWLANFLTRTLKNNNTGVQEPLTPFLSGSNASAQEGAVYSAIAVYTNNNARLNYVWNRFRLYSCDRVNNPEQTINVHTGFDGGWSFTTDYSQACAVNPAGTIKNGHRIDGAIINDMVRGGSFTWPPGSTNYPWVGLEGYVPAALVLYRASFPSFQLKDQVVKRTHEYLCYLKNNTSTDWWQSSRAAEVKHLVKVIYGFNQSGCSVSYPTGKGRTVGYTDWTHPNGI